MGCDYRRSGHLAGRLIGALGRQRAMALGAWIFVGSG